MSEQNDSSYFTSDEPADLDLLGAVSADEPATNEPAAPAVEVAEPDDVATTENSEPEDDPQEEPPTAKRDAAIPRARFDEVNAKLHAQREENARLLAALEERNAQQAREEVTKPIPVDVTALEKKYFAAMLDGDEETAISVRARINAQIAAQAEAAATERVSKSLTEREQRSAAERVQTEFAAVVAQTVQAYPFLDSTSDKASPDAIADVLEWRDFYISKGATPGSALAKAAERVAKLYTIEPEKEPVADKRKQKALEVAASVNNAQPPRVDAGVGARAIPTGDEILVDQNKWDKASEADRRQFLQ